MILKRRHIAGACIATIALAAGITVAAAALPPFWQSAREISMIVNDPRVHDALKYEEPILSVTATGDDVYELKTPRCTLLITIVDAPNAEPMLGPRQFDLEVGAADCQ